MLRKLRLGKKDGFLTKKRVFNTSREGKNMVKPAHISQLFR